MPALIQFAKRRPLLAYYVLACALTWPLAPLIAIQPVYGLPGLFAPAISAVVITYLSEGRDAVRALLGRLLIWRAGAQWYIFALAFPLLASRGFTDLGVLLGTPDQVQLSPITALSIIVFIMVAGEEIGWRGFALPKMMQTQYPLQASLVLGVLWAVWHLPAFLLPGMPQTGIPVLAFVIYTMALSILFTWMYQHTAGSLLLATLFHGAIDVIGFINPAMGPELRWWLIAFAYAIAAFIVVLSTGPHLKRTGPTGALSPAEPTQLPPAPPAAP